MELDWSALHKTATTVIEGDFPVVIVEAVATQSSGGKPMIKCKLKVESGPNAGHVLWHNFTISAESSGAMRMFFGHMAVLGLDANFFAANPTAPLDTIAQALLQRRATAEIGSRLWQGTAREEIKAWKPIVGPGGAPLGVSPGLGAAIAPVKPASLASMVPSTTPLAAPQVAPSTAPAAPATEPPPLPF